MARPGHDLRARRGDFASATVVQVRRHAKGCLSHLIGASDVAVVVGPSRDFEQYLGDRASTVDGSPTCSTLTRTADRLSGARAACGDRSRPLA
jgi:hypothetical protein